MSFNRKSCPLCSRVEVATRLHSSGIKCPLCDNKGIVSQFVIDRVTPLRTTLKMQESNELPLMVNASTSIILEFRRVFKQYRVELEVAMPNSRAGTLKVKTVPGYPEIPIDYIDARCLWSLGYAEKGSCFWLYTSEWDIGAGVNDREHIKIVDEKECPHIVYVHRAINYHDEMRNSHVYASIENSKNKAFETQDSAKNRSFHVRTIKGNYDIAAIDGSLLDQLGVVPFGDVYFGIPLDLNKCIKPGVFDTDQDCFYGDINPLSLAIRTRNFSACSEVLIDGQKYGGSLPTEDESKSTSTKSEETLIVGALSGTMYDMSDDTDDDDDELSSGFYSCRSPAQRCSKTVFNNSSYVKPNKKAYIYLSEKLDYDDDSNKSNDVILSIKD